jgi:hypothetical protein
MLSLVSVVEYRSYVYFMIIMNAYEAITIAAFFILVLQFMAPDLEGQQKLFISAKLMPWTYPVKLFKPRVPKSGLTWFNVSSASILGEQVRTKFSDGLDRHFPVQFYTSSNGDRLSSY